MHKYFLVFEIQNLKTTFETLKHRYMLRQSLQQKLLQKLSPQQIQLMKLLQVPTVELEQRIKEEIEILQKEISTSNEMISLHYQLLLSYNNLLNSHSNLFKNINLRIPFDDEQEIMIIKNNIVEKYQKIEEKTYQNMILNTKILKLKDTMLYIKTQTNEIDEDINFSKKASCLCNICDENKINICLIPCGHTFCNVCLSKTIGNLCPYCRENINFHNKLFIE